MWYFEISRRIKYRYSMIIVTEKVQHKHKSVEIDSFVEKKMIYMFNYDVHVW